jgi:carbon storage regulator
MLVLSRKPGEALLIDGVTVIRVLEVRGGQIRLGIEAPADVAVLRAELGERQAERPNKQLADVATAHRPRRSR